MPWSTTRTPGTDAKYRTPTHRHERKRQVRGVVGDETADAVHLGLASRVRRILRTILKRDGSVECAQPVCIMPSRTIYDGEPTHLGHDDSGTAYIGLVHPACNVTDGARRGNARSRGLEGGPEALSRPPWVL